MTYRTLGRLARRIQRASLLLAPTVAAVAMPQGEAAPAEAYGLTNLVALGGALLAAAGLGFIFWLVRHPSESAYADPSVEGEAINAET